MQSINDIQHALKEWKQDKNLTFNDMKEITGVSIPTIRSWMNDDNTDIKQATYDKISPHIKDYLPQVNKEGLIRNTETIRNTILFKMVSTNKTQEDLIRVTSDEFPKVISGEMTDITGELMSRICVELDIHKDKLQLSPFDEALLIIELIRAERSSNYVEPISMELLCEIYLKNIKPKSPELKILIEFEQHESLAPHYGEYNTLLGHYPAGPLTILPDGCFWMRSPISSDTHKIAAGDIMIMKYGSTIESRSTLFFTPNLNPTSLSYSDFNFNTTSHYSNAFSIIKVIRDFSLETQDELYIPDPF